MLYTQLRAFHAVARRGSFTRAADALDVSQPTVSEQVKSLESRFQVRLFERQSRRVEPTDLGRSLLLATSRLFSAEDEAEQLLVSARGLAFGRLRVGADSPYLVIPLLGTFRRRHPGIQISVSLGNSESVLGDLLARRADVAVLPEIATDPRLHTVPLRADRLVAIVPRGHAWAARSSVELSELAASMLVLRESGSRTRALFERAVADAGCLLGEVLEIGSREAVRESVAAGLGVGVIAASELGTDPRLHALAIRHPGLEVTEYAACVAERRGVRVVSAFLDLVRESTGPIE